MNVLCVILAEKKFSATPWTKRFINSFVPPTRSVPGTFRMSPHRRRCSFHEQHGAEKRRPPDAIYIFGTSLDDIDRFFSVRVRVAEFLGIPRVPSLPLARRQLPESAVFSRLRPERGRLRRAACW